MRWLALTLVALVALGPGVRGEQGEIGAPPLVQVDVTVVDAAGRAVPAIPPDAFHLTGADSPELLSVGYIPPPAGDEPPLPAVPIGSVEDERAAAARPGARITAFYLDEYHVSKASTDAVRAALRSFVQEQTREGDLLLVVRPLDSLLDLRLTGDRAAVLTAVDRFEGRLGDYQPRSRLEAEMMAGDSARLDAQRAQVALSAIQAIATHLARIADRRKALVVVSEGFVAPASRRGGAPIPGAEAIARLANRYTVAVYAGDPTPADRSVTPDDPRRALLERLASDTGGRVMRGALTDGLARVGRELSGYYLLTVRAPADGRFHPLQVTVARPGVTVAGRPGFWAVSADDLAVARLAAAPPAPRRVVAPIRTSRLIVPWFGQDRGGEGRTRVTFVWEPARSGAGLPPRGLPPSRLLVKATAEDGTSLYEGTLAPAMSEQAGGEARASFETRPGRVRLEMTIEDAAARVLDTDVRDVLVSALAGRLVVGTPTVFRARTARAFAGLERRPDAAPTASRDFSRVERLLIRVPVYSASGDPRVSAVLRNRSGHVLRDLPVTLDPAGRFTVDLPLASFAPGEYNVVVAAREGGARETRGDDGQDAVKETVSFRVTP